MIYAHQILEQTAPDSPMLATALVSFSQMGEDLLVCELLKSEKERGIYIDLGAHHPIRLSNTLALYLDGWSGINVDGNLKSIQYFQELRARDINIHAVVSDREEDVTFYQFEEGALNTSDKEIGEARIQSERPVCSNRSACQNRIRLVLN